MVDRVAVMVSLRKNRALILWRDGNSHGYYVFDGTLRDLEDPASDCYNRKDVVRHSLRTLQRDQAMIAEAIDIACQEYKEEKGRSASKNIIAAYQRLKLEAQPRESVW